MKKTIILLTVVFFTLYSCKETQEKAFTVEQHTDANGFSYETVTNDPTGLRLYTLENGLKVYLSRNTEEPKIQTFIPVRAGSVYDPSDNTGLAHYLEHMLFKGTDQIGTQDWEAEKIHLDKIANLYEQHKAEKDSTKKIEIYKQIDVESQSASKISIAAEYDKMISSLGAEGTNAWTWHEETVYVNKIPSNGLEKWLHVESERFSKLVLRLFHTELEAVYEEFNRSQDSDFRRASSALNAALFPTHQYGQQNTIGTSEHLKNPSMEAIHNYFNTYYVPNNMAVILVGDLEFEETIEKVNNAFGSFKTKEVNHPERPIEAPLTSIIEKEVFGPENERVNIAYRSAAIGTEDEVKLSLIDQLLSNSTAGLIDLNLNKKQQVQRAGSYTTFLNDYGMHQFYGNPKSGQTLEEVKDLIIGQIEEVKKGNFDEWMLDAVINDLKLSKIRMYENASGVAYDYVNAFVHFQDWNSRVNLHEKMRKINKQELVDFANKFYKDNYVVVYKRQGKATDLVKVANPKITPIELNRGKNSPFVTTFNKMTSAEMKPQFIDYKTAIKNSKLANGLEIAFIPNETNDLAELNIIFDMGDDHNKKLGIAVGYLEYLGTNEISIDDLSKEFYKLGVDYGVRTGRDRTTIYLSGLRENLSKGLALLENLLENAQANQDTYNKYVLKIAKDRQDVKSNKSQIMWSGLYSYGQFGEESRLRDIYTIEELKAMDPKELVTIVKGLKDYKHRIFYYGKDLEEAKTALNTHHKIPSEFKEYPEKKEYDFKETGGNVYFVNYDMVQAEMLFLAKGDTFDPKSMAASKMFNSYFGGSMASVVFQEIRESKSLAYSAFSFYADASKVGDPNYTYAYIGTQANKMPEAVDAMMGLMNKMPKAEVNFKVAKTATLKKMAARRINKKNIFLDL
ncbi:MAG: insulinase family protein [Cellulophaga sp.]